MKPFNKFAICIWMLMMLVWVWAGIFLFTKMDVINRCLMVIVGIMTNIFLIMHYASKDRIERSCDRMEARILELKQRSLIASRDRD